MNNKKPAPKTSWKAPEFVYVTKTKDWYWILWIIGLLIAGISVVVENIIFAVFMVLATFVLTLLAQKKPETIPITITPKVLLIGNKRYQAGQFESYKVIPELSRILLLPKRKLSPLVIVPLAPSTSILQVEKILGLSQIKLDENLNQSFLDLMFEQLGL